MLTSASAAISYLDFFPGLVLISSSRPSSSRIWVPKLSACRKDTENEKKGFKSVWLLLFLLLLWTCFFVVAHLELKLLLFKWDWFLKGFHVLHLLELRGSAVSALDHVGGLLADVARHLASVTLNESFGIFSLHRLEDARQHKHAALQTVFCPLENTPDTTQAVKQRQRELSGTELHAGQLNDGICRE